MKPLCNFGISQDDALVENHALQLKSGDRLLCVASAGEVPLNLLAMKDIIIDAVDISCNQLFLCALKLSAIHNLEPLDAASFLGFTESSAQKQAQFFYKVSEGLTNDARKFWTKNYWAIEAGPIKAARFEKYILLFSGLGLAVLGKKKLLRLFEFNTVEEQQNYFDNYLDKRLLKIIFRIAFNPKLYKKRGIENSGLQHSGERDIAQFFFERFRHFCTGTIARYNYFLQFTFFGKIMYREAFPEYLQEKGVSRIRINHTNLTFHQKSFNQILTECKKGEYNKYALSNIGDWMSVNDYQELLSLVIKKANYDTLILSRYIHLNHTIPRVIKNFLKENSGLSKILITKDRYPFYSLVPLRLRIPDVSVEDDDDQK